MEDYKTRMIVYIDVSEMLRTDFLTGIQRVVKEVTLRWIRNKYEVKLLAYDEKDHYFRVVDNDSYYQYYMGLSRDKNVCTDERMQISDFNDKMIFYDMDSVWMGSLKRSYLLPLLKSQGVKLAAHIYDIIPITEPQFCEEFTVFNFMEYIGAQLKYADLIIANAQATIDAIKQLIAGTDVADINGYVVKLGSDIARGDHTVKPRVKIKQIADKGRYVLMVGTLEPRKNHKYVLDAFEECLFAEGINLIFAGRTGWNIDELMKRIDRHPLKDKQLFYISDASDSEISYLYENCAAVAFPSFNEGFGLPVIEAINRKAVVLASDIPVLREVGGAYCRYFSLEDKDGFIQLVRRYVSDNAEIGELKRKMLQYILPTWDDCAENMYTVLQMNWNFHKRTDKRTSAFNCCVNARKAIE